MNNRLKNSIKLTFYVTVILICFNFVYKTQIYSNVNEVQNQWQTISINEISFDHNITGYPINIVPNIVHYVLFSINEIQFGHFLSLLSVLRNQRPDKIYIHCDCHEIVGQYYKRVIRVAKKTKTEIILIKYILINEKLFIFISYVIINL